MPSSYTLSVPSPRTFIATLLRPLLERLVLWYLRDLAAQQSEVNAEVARRLTSLASDLRQEFSAALDAQCASLASDLRQEFSAALDELAAQMRAFSNELTTYSQRSTLPFQILANQVASLADLLGICIVVLSRDNRSSDTLSGVSSMQNQDLSSQE